MVNICAYCKIYVAQSANDKINHPYHLSVRIHIWLQKRIKSIVKSILKIRIIIKNNDESLVVFLITTKCMVCVTFSLKKMRRQNNCYYLGWAIWAFEPFGNLFYSSLY